MNEISAEIFEKYQTRKTKKQKTRFIEFLKTHFPELKIEKGGFGGNRNIVIGDVESAKAVLTAHYDTCALLPIPNFIMPKRPVISFCYGIVIALPILILAIFGGALAGFITKNPEIGGLSEALIFWILFILMFAGKASKTTANDNTSGVITLIEILSTMSEEERAQTCFVFFDNEENGLLGSAFFAKKHKKIMKNKLLINFDCVSDGDYLMLIANKKAYDEHSEKLKNAFSETEGKTVLIEKEKGIYYPSDQKNFKKNIGVASFKNGKFGLYMDKIHTKKDTAFDEKNIAVLVSGIRKFLEA